MTGVADVHFDVMFENFVLQPVVKHALRLLSVAGMCSVNQSNIYTLYSSCLSW
jgi:hypothetical protein